MNFRAIQGSGGQGFNSAPSGGGNSKFTAQGVVADNTLRSTSFARVVEMIGEGPIVGLVNGGTSIYFNKTPVVNADGTVNFRGIQWESRTGLPDQAPLPGNATSSTNYPVNIQVQASVPPPVVTIVDPNVTSCQVIVDVPSLNATDSNGNVSATDLSWEVQCQPTGGGWEIMDTVNLSNQKCMSEYQHQSTFTLPANGAPWNIRVVRLTGDSDTTNLNNATYFDSYIEVIAGSFIYPNTALVGLTVDAELFQQGTIPSRFFHVQGLIIQVPSNYNPTTRVYTGVWDGTFQSEYTNNPAWILYDILTNNRYGIGDYIDATKIDKWGLYTIAQYCDQLVPNGYGGQEPRYVFNGVLNNRQEAWKAIQSITSSFRGMTYWAAGQVFATADMPSDSVKLVSPANVIDGRFSYSGTGLKTRHSVAMVRWNDPVTLYQPTVEVVVNDAQLQAFGWRESNLTAVGCTSRGQANRMGKWMLDTEQFSTETIEYSCSWDHMDVRPGSIITVADPNKNQIRLGGRITQAQTGAITFGLDQPFVATAGQTYTFMVELPDGTIASTPVALFSTDGTLVTLTSGLAQYPIVGAMYIITGSNIEPRKYRITNISETEKNIFKVTALFYDPTKYERIEEAISLPVIPYSLPKTTIDPPNNFVVTETFYTINAVASSRVTLSWSPSADFMASSYTINGLSPNGGAVTPLGSSSGSSFDIDNIALGPWTFYIQSVGIDGRVSTWVSTSFTTLGWAALPSPYVSNLEVFGQATDTTFTGTDCHVVWTDNFPGSTSDIGQETVVGTGSQNTFYRNDIVTVTDTATGERLRQEVVYTEDYIYTIAKNTVDYANYNAGPSRSFTIQVQVEDTLGRTSATDSIAVSNPAPALMSPTITSAGGNIYVSWVPPSDPDYVGCVVWVSLDPNFDPLATAPIYQGPNNFFVYPGIVNSTYYVRIAGYDAFGANSLNISPSTTVLCDGFQPDTAPPVVPTNLGLTSSPLTMPTGEVIQTLTASWDTSTSSNFAYFEVAIAQGSGTYISNQTALNTYTYANGIIASDSYSVKVRAWSQSGYVSAWCNARTLVIGPKSNAPGAPTNLAISASLKSAYLFWSNPADPDIDHVEIWQGSSSAFTSASLIGTSYATAFTVTGLTTGTIYNYWIRAVNTSGIPSAYLGPIAVTPGAVANGDIAAGSITADRIVAGSITGNQINVNTTFPATISIGSTGITLGGALAAATANPAVTINGGTTLIAPGLIQLSGATTLTSWQSGADATKIAGGFIAANTISANSLTIGNRGLQITGLQFSIVGAVVSWTAGLIYYMGDDGTLTGVSVVGGRATYTGGVLYFTWSKDAPTLVASTFSTFSANVITFATYSTGSGLVVTYGATQVDGSNVITGSIQATKIAAGSITAQQIAAGSITATQIAAGTITAANIAAGAITANSIAIGAVGSAQLGPDVQFTPGVGSITGTMIANGAISTAQLAANSVTAANIAAGTITAATLGVTSLSAISANMGNVTAGYIQSATLTSTGVPVMQMDLAAGIIYFSA